MRRTTKQEDTGEDIGTFVGGLTDRVLHCRDVGHTWKPLTVSWDREHSCYDRRLRCPSCRTVRIQLLTQSGHPVSNRYVYPDGYLAKGSTRNGMTRDVFRLEAVQRFLQPKQGVA